MPEWLNGAVSKTAIPISGSEVRILLSPSDSQEGFEANERRPVGGKGRRPKASEPALRLWE